jgi:hypothetical protein
MSRFFKHRPTRRGRRVVALPLTAEDRVIFVALALRGVDCKTEFWADYLFADRRDADIMLALAQATHAGCRMAWIGRAYLFHLGLAPAPTGRADQKWISL